MSLRVLLADDSMTAQNMGKKILADAGYDVVAVSNGAAAVKKLPEFRPDIVVADVYMPGYSGLEVCERIKGAPEFARVPVLLSVGKLEPFRPEEGIKVRADGVIIKPFEATDLLAVMEKLAERIAAPAPPPPPPPMPAAAYAAAPATFVAAAPVMEPPAPTFAPPANEASAAPSFDVAPAFNAAAPAMPDYVREFGLEEPLPTAAVENVPAAETREALPVMSDTADAAFLDQLLADEATAAPAAAATVDTFRGEEAAPGTVPPEDDFDARLAAAMAAYEDEVPGEESAVAEKSDAFVAMPESQGGIAEPVQEESPLAAEYGSDSRSDAEPLADPFAFAQPAYAAEPAETEVAPVASAIDSPLDLDLTAELPAVADEPVAAAEFEATEPAPAVETAPSAWVAEEAPLEAEEALSLEAEMQAYAAAPVLAAEPEAFAQPEPLDAIQTPEPASGVPKAEVALREPVGKTTFDSDFADIMDDANERFWAAAPPAVNDPAGKAAPATEDFVLDPALEVDLLDDAPAAPAQAVAPAELAPAYEPVVETGEPVRLPASFEAAIAEGPDELLLDDEFTFQGEPFASLQMDAPAAEEPAPAEAAPMPEAVSEPVEDIPFASALAPTVFEAATPLMSAGVSEIDESVVAEIVYRVLDNLKPAIVAEITAQLNERLARRK